MVAPADQPTIGARLLAAGVTLPLRTGFDGEILDANGECDIVVDPNREKPDDAVKAIADAIVAAVNAPAGIDVAPEPALPVGMKLVPIEPTRPMWAAGDDAVVGYKQRHHDKVVAQIWSAMLAAAPASATPFSSRAGIDDAPPGDMPPVSKDAGGDETFTGVEAWDELVNVDDRTSPEEYPDMCLITRDELVEFCSRAALSAPPPVQT